MSTGLSHSAQAVPVEPAGLTLPGQRQEPVSPWTPSVMSATPAAATAPLARRYRILLRVADAVALTAAALLGALVLSVIDPNRAGDISWPEITLTSICMAVAFHLHGLYRRPAARLRPSGWWRPSVVARCMPTAVLLTLGTQALLFGGDRSTLTAAVAMTLPAVVLAPLGRALAVRVFGQPTITRILVVGSGRVTDRLVSRLGRCPDTAVVGQVDDEPTAGSIVLGTVADMPDLCAEHAVDRIIVAFSRTQDREVLEHLRRLGGAVPVSVLPRLFEMHSWRSEMEELHGLPLLHVRPASLGLGARFCKRVLDLVLTSLALVVIAPVLAAAALAIKADSPGPVFFRQERLGRGGRAFQIFKFRTMTADAWDRRSDVSDSNEVDGPLFKMASDPRVTRIGAFLRRTSIDEVPQLFNVLLGEMSLVGPRPLPTEESQRLDGAALTRFDVAPGLTGLWQVSGRSDLAYADLQHLDSVYVRSWSLMWDLRIILATPASVLGRRGAY